LSFSCSLVFSWQETNNLWCIAPLVDHNRSLEGNGATLVVALLSMIYLC